MLAAEHGTFRAYWKSVQYILKTAVQCCVYTSRGYAILGMVCIRMYKLCCVQVCALSSSIIYTHSTTSWPHRHIPHILLYTYINLSYNVYNVFVVAEPRIVPHRCEWADAEMGLGAAITGGISPLPFMPRNESMYIYYPEQKQISLLRCFIFYFFFFYFCCRCFGFCASVVAVVFSTSRSLTMCGRGHIQPSSHPSISTPFGTLRE